MIKTVPHIIHQTWRDESVPVHLALLAESWKEKHPGWDYKLWTDQTNREFIKSYYPDFLPVYDQYPYNIQRVDAVRYFILYHMGGVFIDLDFECMRYIGPLLKDHTCVLGLEPDAHCQKFGKKKIICNAFMASTQEHDFFKVICNALKVVGPLKAKDCPQWLQVLETTGPFKLTRLYDCYTHKERIGLLPANILYPLSIEETRAMLEVDEYLNEGMEAKIETAFAIHYFQGSWWE